MGRSISDTVIPASVLPLRHDGAIYHLNLKPGEVADTVILVGDPERVSLVSRHFDSIEVKKSNREFVTHTGVLKGQRVSVVSTGIGTANIDIVLNELDALHNIDFSTRQIKAEPTSMRCLRLGTCGAVQPETQPGSVVGSRYAVGFDNQMLFYPRALSDQEERVKKAVVEHLNSAIVPSCYVAAASDWFDSWFTFGDVGVTFTCPGFYAAQNRCLRAPILAESIFDCVQRWSYPGEVPLNFEMETAMIYGLGRVLGHRCGSISLVVYNRHTQQGCDYDQAMPELIQQTLEHLV